MTGSDHTVHLTEPECWALLSTHTVARLAVAVGQFPDIFPINYLVDDGAIVFRSGAGTKLAAAVLGRHVALEIDGLDDHDHSVWSVVLKGEASEISTMTERYAADDLPLYPWVASNKPNFVRIDPTSVTGRRFHVVDGVDVEQQPAVEHHPGAPRLRPD